jgi:hypothetical protein
MVPGHADGVPALGAALGDQQVPVAATPVQVRRLGERARATKNRPDGNRPGENRPMQNRPNGSFVLVYEGS